MKLAIVGSRTFNDKNFFNKMMEFLEDKYEIEAIVSGGAKGADSMGEEYADSFGIEKEIFLPDWNKYGKRAGFLRNVDIIKNCDVCVAFWDGVSHGTKHDIDLCKKYNKHCYIANFVNGKVNFEENNETK